MEHHESRKELDKAQRDDVFRLIDAIVEHVEYYTVKRHKKSHYSYAFVKEDIPALKSLKAMVEPFDTTGKQVEDSGDVRHEQKTVTGNDVKKVARRWLITPFRLGESLKELGIKVTDKEKEADKTMQRREERGAYLRNPKRIGTRYKVTDKEG